MVSQVIKLPQLLEMEQVTRSNPNNYPTMLATIINSGGAVNLNCSNLVNVRTVNGEIKKQNKT